MNNRIGFKLISLIVATIFCLQGCIWRTISVDEQMRELSRKPPEIGRKYKIVLTSQSSVRIYEEVKMGNAVKYEVIDVKRKGRATGGDIVKDTISRLIFFPVLVVGTGGLGLVIVFEEDFWYLGRFKNEVIACKQQKGIQITKKDTRRGSDSRYLFSQKLPLKTGRNKIEVIAWDTDNLEDRKSIFVTRSKVTSEVWAAIIGINDYKNQGIPDLKYAVADARAMYEYLQNHMNISPDHIFALYDENASKTEIEKILGDILPRKARPQDTVIIYYSGHGAPDSDPSSPDGDNVSKYLLASDTDPESMWATAVPMERIRAIFSRISSERVVFLADTCYSGASGGKTLAMSTRASLNDNFLDRLAAGRGRVIITASGAGELAREDKNLGGGHGVFTYYLLEGLKGAADADGDKLITSGEAYEYVFKNVSRHTQNMQHPIKKGEEERPIILGVIK